MSMRKPFVLLFLFCLILFSGNSFACDQIVNWENDDREFFDGYDGTSRSMSNNPTARHIDDFTGVRSSVPVTRYTSPVIYHSDGWVGSVSIYSYDSDANAGADFSNENIVYRGDFTSPVSMTKFTWISKTGDELIYGERRSLGGDIQTLISAAGVVLYRNCIINYSVRPPTGQYTDQSTAYSKSQILISQAKALIDSKCGNTVTPSETSTLKLHINNHPLKNLKVLIDEKIFTTDDTGEVEIPDDGEALLQFTYYDGIEYFSIYVESETNPFGLRITTNSGKITKLEVIIGDRTESAALNIKINEFDFKDMGTFSDVYATAKRYVHISEALEFYQDLGVVFTTPLKVVSFVNYAGKAAYLNNKILIDRSLSDRPAPGSKTFLDGPEWTPFTEYHEFSHYAMHQMYGDAFFNELLKSPNHGGFANPTTADSWMEGFAAFMAVVIANHYDRWWTDRPLEKRLAFYPMAGSLDANYKAWEKEGKAEEFAIAGFLWDFIDGESQSFEAHQWAELDFGIVFGHFGWDVNEDKKLTAEEIYVGQLMDYAHKRSLGSVTWANLIKMGKHIESYFDLEPDMALFDTYDKNKDGFLDLDELMRMADILNDDGSSAPSEWLEYYDDGDNKISTQEAEHLFTGYAIIMEVSNGLAVSDRDDVKEWVKDPRITDFIDDNGYKPIKNEMSASEFTEYLLAEIGAENDDDPMNWSFESLWEEVLSKRHRDFSSVIYSLLDIRDVAYEEALGELLVLHGMYQSTSRGDEEYNIGEAFTDSIKNNEWDTGEDFIDYPYSWKITDLDPLGAPSNYERIGRESTPYFRGNYVKAPEGDYEIVYLIKDGMRIKDIVGYTATSDGMLYVPVPPESMVSVSSENEAVTSSSALLEENFNEIVEQGYISEIKDDSSTNIGTDDDGDSGGSGGGGCFVSSLK